MMGWEEGIRLFQSGGPVMYPLLFLSLVTVAIAVERWQYYKKNGFGRSGFSDHLTQALRSGADDEAETLLLEADTAPARILRSGWDCRGKRREMKEALAVQMEVEYDDFRRYLDYVSAIVTVAPLLGLLGTVSGMIGTFEVLDSSSGAGASAITGGVGEALIATATGLCVAIVAFCVYTYFDHRCNALMTATERLGRVMTDAEKMRSEAA